MTSSRDSNPPIANRPSGNIPSIHQSSNLPILRYALLAVLLSTTLAASDWPQFLGPSRNGVYSGTLQLNEKWPSTGPRVLWRKQVGAGLSGPVVAGKRLVLFHRVDNREVIDSFDALSGAPQWRHAYPTAIGLVLNAVD